MQYESEKKKVNGVLKSIRPKKKNVEAERSVVSIRCPKRYYRFAEKRMQGEARCYTIVETQGDDG